MHLIQKEGFWLQNRLQSHMATQRPCRQRGSRKNIGLKNLMQFSFFFD